MKNLLKYSFLLLICGFLAIGCGEDEPEAVPGCTDMEADNFSSTATESDGSCTYFDRITGVYIGTFDCEGFLAALLLDETTLTIIEFEQPSTVGMGVSVPSLPIPIPLEGMITDKNTVDVSNTITNIELTGIDVLPAHEGERFDITITGQLVLSEDGSMISGPLNFSLKEVALGLDIDDQQDSCIFTAERQ
jgi:hypothetical protein